MVEQSKITKHRKLRQGPDQSRRRPTQEQARKAGAGSWMPLLPDAGAVTIKRALSGFAGRPWRCAGVTLTSAGLPGPSKGSTTLNLYPNYFSDFIFT
ncbi:hypothetical protein E2C01_035742 [Portunus trituberculatus]|uniref:Uncharacterized protein n=1 Tax=Portunus trituberculatus TaxID=210409 RepID=A0A5B7FAJ9_PORTR|nr:hypothetical protein [Portunus trituberculatus]